MQKINNPPPEAWPSQYHDKVVFAVVVKDFPTTYYLTEWTMQGAEFHPHIDPFGRPADAEKPWETPFNAMLYPTEQDAKRAVKAMPKVSCKGLPEGFDGRQAYALRLPFPSSYRSGVAVQEGATHGR